MISKTRMQSLVKEFLVDEVASGLQEKPALLQFRDERGRNWLHLCANVDVSTKVTLDPQESVRLAALLLERGVEINVPAFTEGTWHAPPLWYATARGRNLVLAKFLLQSGSTPEHCLWAASYHEDLPMLRTLVAGGAPLEAIAEGETPLLGQSNTANSKRPSCCSKWGAIQTFRTKRV